MNGGGDPFSCVSNVETTPRTIAGAVSGSETRVNPIVSSGASPTRKTDMRTYVPKGKQLDRRWWVVDAESIPLGRLASAVAVRLQGKHKPTYTPFIDTGDHRIVINAEKVALTGRKLDQKVYRRHSGHPGGLSEVGARRLMDEKPERAVEQAVKRMLPKNKIGRQMLSKLRVYRGSDHPHEAQKPEPLAVDASGRVK